MKKSGLTLDMEGYGNIVASVYEAAIQPERWGDTLLEICKPINCHLGHIIDVSEKSAISYHKSTQGSITDALIDFQSEVAAGVQPRVNYALTQDSMSFFTDAQIIREQDMCRDPYYCGSGTKYDVYFSVNAVLSQVPSRLSAIGCYRSKNSGPISADELAYFKSISQHVRRSIELMQYSRIRQLTGEITEHLNELITGVIVLDKQAHIVGLNSKAEAIINRHDGIYDVDRRIVLRDPRAQQKLNQEIDALTVNRDFKITPEPSFTTILRKNSISSYQILVTPLTNMEDTIAGLSALICIIDPDEEPQNIKVLLRQMYQLTASETELLSALYEGFSLNEFAEMNSLSKETPRYHLKSIFAKTGTNRQTQLILKVKSEIKSSNRLQKFRKI